ncbi:hypothetical protein V8C42DRAFT_60507 [Trichoderma barbatum]
MATSPINISHPDMPHPDNASSQLQPSLARDVATNTRRMHTKVNQLVTSRLPLALPPHASDAGPYISGMLHFLPVYMTFEKLWQDIYDIPLGQPVADGFASPQGPVVPEHVHTILKELYISELFRSDRLKADMKSMTGWSDDVLDCQIDAVLGSDSVIERNNNLGVFISHIKQTVAEKPHTLIAYSYNLFMALFAGGRYIRATLEEAGDGFWKSVHIPTKPVQLCEPTPPATPPPESTYSAAETSSLSHVSSSIPLQFWRFDAVEDGEGLKRDYKERLFKLEDKLTPEERSDIVQESIIILESIESIIGQLDGIHCNQQGDQQKEKPSDQIPRRPSLASLVMQTLRGVRIRDSFMIAKERGVGASFRSQFLDPSTTEEGDHTFEDKHAKHDNAANDIELCPGIPKSMRFAKSLPVPPRRHVRVAAAKDRGFNGKSGVRSPRQPANTTLPRPLVVGVIGLFLLYIYIRVRGIMS